MSVEVFEEAYSFSTHTTCQALLPAKSRKFDKAIFSFNKDLLSTYYVHSTTNSMMNMTDMVLSPH